MILLTWLLLLGLAWGLWNLYQKLHRLDALIAQWQETLATVKGLDADSEALPEAVRASAESASPLRVIIEITDALELAKRYHWAGGAGGMAPAVLKKVMQDKVLERVNQSMHEAGHEADLKVIVL